MMLEKIKNIPYKLRKELYKIPQIHTIKEEAHQSAVDYHSSFLPFLDHQGQLIVDTMRENGTCIIPLEQLNLNLSTSEQMMSKALSLATKLKTYPQSNKAENCEVDLKKADFQEFPEFLLWAVQSQLLDIIENYIELPILYQGYAIRRSFADGQYSGVRRWHIDWEDRRVIKVIIYLNDVGVGDGAYEYIERNKTAKAIKALNYYNLGYISDGQMRTAVSPTDWTTCLGLQGSVIISDTTSVFHRAQPPINQDRYSITFCYTSASPMVIWANPSVTREEWLTIDRQLNHRQRYCLTPRKFS